MANALALERVPAHLRQEVARLAEASVATETRRGYNRMWDEFREFSQRFFPGEQVYRVSQERLIAYVAHLSSLGRSHGGAMGALSAISWQLKFANQPDVPRSGYLDLVLKGMKKSSAAPQDVRTPVSLPILRRLCKAVGDTTEYSAYEKCLFCCVMVTAFFGLFRASELVGKHRLEAADVMLQGSVRIRLRSAKNSAGQEHVVILAPQVSVPDLCPVAHIARFLEQRRTTSRGFFVFRSGQMLSQRFFTRELKKWVQRAGLSALNITPHSFRIGDLLLSPSSKG